MTVSNGNNKQDHASRLHAAYARLTFKCDPADPQDTRREALFQRLVQHHLLNHLMLTRTDWLDMPKQQECTYDFIEKHAKALWPGSTASRSHLAHPQLARSSRSFVGDVDGHWSGKGGGSKAKVNESIRHGCYDLDSPVGRRSLSKVGKAFYGYVNVLLQPAPTNSRVEEPERLIKGILSVEVGPDVPSAEIDGLNKAAKAEDESEGELAMKVEDGSD